MGNSRLVRRAAARRWLLVAGIALAVLVPRAAYAATASFSSITPRSGATMADTRPTISVRVNDSYGISGAANSALWLDGRVLPVRRVVSRVTRLTLSYRPGSALSAGVHRVTARVRDRKKRISTYSWSFTVAAASVPPTPPVQSLDMPVSIDASSCGTCHVSYPAQHPMTQCQSCHGTDRPVPGVAFNQTSTSAHTLACASLACHNGPPGTPFPHSMWTDCARCHAGQFAGIPTGHGALSAASHESTNTFCTRSGCHDASLTVEHYRHSVAGARLSCASCHASTDANVRAALDSASTDCLSCHPGATTTHPGLSTAHAPVAGTCAACHSGDLPTIHKGACTPCHAPGVTPSARCADCHTDASHATLHVIVRTDTCTGAQCHDGTSLTAIQEGTATVAPHQLCVTCHQSTDPAVVSAISTGNKNCSACHGAFTDHAAQHAVDRSLDTCSGANCHPTTLTSLTTLHPACATCHGSADPAVVAAIAAKKTACSACHAFSGHQAVHSSSLDASCIAPGCHASTSVDLTVQHATCATCHDSTDPAVHAAVAAHDTRCIACHPDAGHIGVHAVTLPADCNGENCHVAPAGNLTFEHMSCSTCHAPTSTTISAAAIAAAIASKNTDCYACHPR